MRILRIIGVFIAALVIGFAIIWLVRTDPMGPLSGRTVTGEEVAYPADWAFTNDHSLIAVETRPDDPHSVTTICLVVDGDLYVPAQNGSEKKWTQYVLDDARVRLKIGDRVYPARAVRVEPDDREPFLAAGRAKYSSMMSESQELPPDIWLFRIEAREGGA
jgi:hypothetical protein